MSGAVEAEVGGGTLLARDYSERWEDEGIYEKPAPYRPCPTCRALGRQCSGCAGHFTYSETKP